MNIENITLTLNELETEFDSFLLDDMCNAYTRRDYETLDRTNEIKQCFYKIRSLLNDLFQEEYESTSGFEEPTF